MYIKAVCSLLVAAVIGVASCGAAEQGWVDPTADWGTMGPPEGAIIIIGGSPDAWAVARFMEMAGGPDAKIVLIPTAGNVVDESNSGYARLKELGATNVTILHTRDRAEADTDAFIEPLLDADGVYISGGFQKRLAESYLHTKTHKALFDVLARGKVIAGNSAGASIQGSYLYGGKDQKEGFGFVRDSAVGQHYIRRSRMGSVARILKNFPDLIGFGVDEDAAALVRGNDLEVIGMGAVAMYDTQSPKWGTRNPQIYLYPGDVYDLAKRKVVHYANPIPNDLWSGADKPWKSPVAGQAERGIANGTLLLYGGEPGDAMLEDFLARVGRDTSIVVVSSGIDVDQAASEKVAERLRELGAKQVTFLHSVNSNDANSAAFTRPLEAAGAVWLCTSQPGQQWRQADTYVHTLLHKQLFDLLARNGTLAANGTAAGMVASDVFTAGYKWNEGYGLLTDTVIFPEPLEVKDKALLKKFVADKPQLLGIGLGDGARVVITPGDVVVEEASANIYDFAETDAVAAPQKVESGKSFTLTREKTAATSL